jgi:AraC family transcriptional regulator
MAGLAPMSRMPRELEAPKYAEPFFTSRERLDAYQHLTVRPLQKGAVVASWVRRDQPGLGLTLPNARSDVCVATVNLRDLNGDDAWCDERHLRRGRNPVGALEVLDHRHVWHTNIPEPFEIVQVFVPLRALNELADELKVAPIETLACTVEAPLRDPVMHGLALALLPAFAKPAEASTLFVDHVFAASRMHLAQTYGGLRPHAEKAHGGLTAWQERRTRELLLDDLQIDRSLADLAAACGLSVRHFARAFKATTGLPPHRWLLRRRVERAKELLESTDDGLSEIALICGFADQSHLTRVFQGLAGSSPGAWRRQRRQ